MRKIVLVDLKAQYKNIKREVDTVIQDVLDNQSFVMGKSVSDFENAFSKFSQVKHTIGVGNGTDALIIALRALGVNQGDDVITVSHTFIATVEACSIVGANVKFVDIDPDTGLMDLNSLKTAITDKTKLVLPVHLYGQMVDIQKIIDIKKSLNREDIKILEDASQAHGASLNGVMPGQLGDAATFSFFPGKNLGAYGDGGAVVTNNDDVATFCRRYRNHGRESKYLHEFPGVNSRLDALQAEILSVKLKYLEQWTNNRRQIAKRYDDLFTDIADVLPLIQDDGASSAYHLYVIKVENRDELLAYLNENGIGAGIHYPVPVHLQPVYESLNYKKGDFPNTELLAEKIISLPIYPELDIENQDYIVDMVLKYYKGTKP